MLITKTYLKNIKEDIRDNEVDLINAVDSNVNIIMTYSDGIVSIFYIDLISHLMGGMEVQKDEILNCDVTEINKLLTDGYKKYCRE